MLYKAWVSEFLRDFYCTFCFCHFSSEDMTHKNIFFRFIFFHLFNFIGCELAEIVDTNDSCTQYPGGVLKYAGSKFFAENCFPVPL